MQQLEREQPFHGLCVQKKICLGCRIAYKYRDDYKMT